MYLILFYNNFIKYLLIKLLHGYCMEKLLIKMDSFLYIESLFNLLINLSSIIKILGKLILQIGKCIQSKRILYQIHLSNSQQQVKYYLLVKVLKYLKIVRKYQFYHLTKH